MSDSANGGAAPDGQQQVVQPKMQILAQFIRDLSFENIVAQKGVQGEVTPDIQVQVALDAKKRTAEDQYEVVCKYNVTSRNKADQSTLFALEMEYGGIFSITNIPDQQLHPFLMIECPRMLFPFARRVISDITRDGGFPQLNLDSIDFVELYRQTLLQRQKAQQAEAEKAKPEAES